ncbi:MAG: hypothetical protein HQK93_08270 [Nitrospirae bacterium]|nr:hypothetical protein [Nitrospirota bacterium]
MSDNLTSSTKSDNVFSTFPLIISAATAAIILTANMLPIDNRHPYKIPKDRSYYDSTTENNDTNMTNFSKGKDSMKNTSFEGTMNVEDTSLIQQFLDKHSIDRLENFKKIPSGWDEDESLQLNNDTIKTMEEFLNNLLDFNLIFNKRPSIFLTNEGNVALGWENIDGKSIELEFMKDKIEYYIESIEMEDFINKTPIKINKLISELYKEKYLIKKGT